MSKFWFTVSQSSLKDLERDDCCPYKWKLSWIDRIRQEPSVYMNQGSYFETKCLGEGAIKGQDVIDLPRLNNGDKSAVHKRIDDQVIKFNEIIHNDLNHKIIDTQRVIKTEVTLNDGTIVELRGVVDFDSVKDDEEWLWDLKLTGNVNSTFGPYPWGDLDRFDFTQQIMYNMIQKLSKGSGKRMGMAVFDTSVNKGVKVFEVSPSIEDEELLMLRIESFVKALKYYKENGFTKYASKKECSKCPFLDKCESRFKEDEIVEEV